MNDARGRLEQLHRLRDRRVDLKKQFRAMRAAEVREKEPVGLVVQQRGEHAGTVSPVLPASQAFDGVADVARELVRVAAGAKLQPAQLAQRRIREQQNYFGHAVVERWRVDESLHCLLLGGMRGRHGDLGGTAKDGSDCAATDGTLYLLTPVGGRTVGAVFRGAAKITMTPPHPAEQEAMQRLINAPALDDSVTEIVLLFSDSTLGELRGLQFGPGGYPDELASNVRDAVESLRGRQDRTYSASVLASLLNDEPDGFFLAHLRRAHGSKLLFQIDPAIAESVQLFKPSSGIVHYSNWTLVTQLARALPGAAASSQWHFRHRVGTPRFQIEVWLQPTPGADLDFAAVAHVTLAADEAVGPWL